MRGYSLRRHLSWLLVPALLLAVLAQAGLTAAQQDKGKPKFTNRLAKETSPYLRMHAHNPVDWYPWGEEALAKAKKEGKLIFLSIGYSSCYWCHVMERESFDHEEVAKIMNKHFIAIKVDREERPDIDQVYMTAMETMGKSGGWPLSMFLTTDGKPIIGGTYWPREDRTIDGEVYRGFKSILQKVHEIYKETPKDVEDHADKMAKATAIALAAPPKAIFAPRLDDDTIKMVLDELRETFDKTYGGFGSPLRGFKGPKFPTPCRLALLLHEGQHNKDKKLLDMVTLTLDKMALGGIYDQLGGGFHRYSTERTWLVPHFEKMLYDNGQLLEVYAQAYRLTKKPLYKRILQETMDYLTREMMSPEGAFYSSQDAETEEEEGRFYVWTLKELEEALPNPDDLKFIRKVYGIAGLPNFEKKYYILNLPVTLAETAKNLGMSEAQLMAKLQPLKEKLFKAREQREKPFLNTIALTAWSGLAIAGFAEAGSALDDARAIEIARKAADFVLQKQVTGDGRLLRIYGAAPGQQPKAAVKGYLEDYAYLVHGLLALHQATEEKRWLDEADKLTKTMIEHHGDKDAGGYYFTAHDGEKLFARGKDSYDGSVPSGNSMAMLNLVRLWARTGNDFYAQEADRGIQTFAKAIDMSPSGLTTMTHALSLYLEQQDKKDQPVKPIELLLPGQQPKPKKKLDPVKAEAKAGKIDSDGNQTITVTLTIDKGWHVYANPVANAELEGADTVIKVTGKSLAKVVKINYPAGTEGKDSPLGKYRTYEGKVAIPVVVQRIKGDDNPLEVSVRYQACDDNSCLLPKTIKLPVP